MFSLHGCSSSTLALLTHRSSLWVVAAGGSLMAVEQRVLPDFSGGEIALRSSTEAAENQWLLLDGFVLDNNRRLRSQWAGATWVVSVEGS